ncbi:MAG: preprotein translocase subunit Sec61beta [Candidatus Aenigmarchaeota archaeon]|nr:preprotein translocase subunit Sec61beta [Candidatus Aenigmarchaeota archaeon]
MAEKKSYLPMSTAGLVRYFEEEKTLVKLKPEHVVIISILFMFLVIFMRLVF